MYLIKKTVNIGSIFLAIYPDRSAANRIAEILETVLFRGKYKLKLISSVLYN